ncbi:MAG: Nramp family divalent metal transporter [Planctomycetaceae bacterium]|nr:Nramp family divalent metal transporter [Planctomycetaceae bacterium]
MTDSARPSDAELPHDSASRNSPALPAGVEPDGIVPDDVIPHHNLPPLRWRDLPEPVSWKKMIGPSIMLAGLSLGSGEFILWPHIVYKSGFVFFWACLIGVVTQFFLNMEIERWTLATGESATTGFCRLSRNWAWVMLIFNIVPWAWPGWATGAAQILSWLMFGPVVTTLENGDVTYGAHAVPWLGIGGLLLVGIVLTTGPVVYNTVERIQTILVGLIVALIAVLAVIVVRADSVLALAGGATGIGRMPDLAGTDLTYLSLLGALAFAGAGGSVNLGQSNFIKDKGYGMGRYIGRITSPLTGQEEAVSEVGYHFPHTPENAARWRGWWRAANIEHFLSFFLTCVVCLCLMSLISFSLFRTSNGFADPAGTLNEGMEQFGSGMNFVWGQATVLGTFTGGSVLKLMFLVTGVAILLTTELGILDATARISADLIKVNWLRDNANWTLGRLYFFFLWGEILLGSAILLVGVFNPTFTEPQFLLVTSAAMNGGVMFIYSLILLYMNSKTLTRSLSLSPVRFLAIFWSAAFFGYFTLQALRLRILPWLMGDGG